MLFIIVVLIMLRILNSFSDWSCIYTSTSSRTYPKTLTELKDILTTSDRVSLMGSMYSHGEQTLLGNTNGISVSMKHFNDVKYLGDSRYYVGAGATWLQVRDHLRQHNKAITVCQSYHDFSVGGSISVCCHGRTGETIYDTIDELYVMTADGQQHTLARTDKLFNAVVGGYGLCAIIIGAILKCTDDVAVKVEQHPISIIDIDINDNSLLWNTYVYMNFKKPYHESTAITWRTNPHANSNISVTDCKKSSNLYGRIGYHALALSGAPCCNEFKIMHDKSLYCNETTMLSNVLTESVGSMLPITSIRLCHFILQEYFVPEDKLHDMLQAIHSIKELEPLLFNVSVRKVKGTPEPLLSWVPGDRIAIVLFFNIWGIRLPFVQANIKTWTNKLIRGALNLGGTFYLPYLRTYDANLIELGYPRLEEFLEFKKSVDPTNKFTSQFHEFITS